LIVSIKTDRALGGAGAERAHLSEPALPLFLAGILYHTEQACPYRAYADESEDVPVEGTHRMREEEPTIG
jgi:hypothetical protein